MFRAKQSFWVTRVITARTKIAHQCLHCIRRKYKQGLGFANNRALLHGSADRKQRIRAYGSRKFCAYPKQISWVSRDFLQWSLRIIRQSAEPWNLAQMRLLRMQIKHFRHMASFAANHLQELSTNQLMRIIRCEFVTSKLVSHSYSLSNYETGLRIE